MSLTTDPTYPVAGELVTVAVSPATGTRVELSLTSVPDASALGTGLVLDSAGDGTDGFTPDVPGAYAVTAFEYRDVSGQAGSYAGDPKGAAYTRHVGATSGTVYCGERMQLPVRTEAGHGFTLRLTVLDATIREAEADEPLTELSRVALLDAGVVAALAAIEGRPANGIDVDFATDVRTLRSSYENHRVQLGGGTAIHASADTVNVAGREPSYSTADAIVSLNALRDTLLQHMQQGAAGGAWHPNDDTKNVPLVGKAKTLGEAVVLKADLRERCYRRHIAQIATPAAHGTADGSSSSGIAAALTLPAFLVAFLDYVAAASTAPTGEQQGAVVLAAGLGFTASR